MRSPDSCCLSGPADFTSSPPGLPLLTLPLSLPFAPSPLAAEEAGDGDIPFPVLRYEEELLAGMLLLQNQAGSVDSLDQLLALQPQCCMPPELARHFQGIYCFSSFTGVTHSLAHLLTPALTHSLILSSLTYSLTHIRTHPLASPPN